MGSEACQLSGHECWVLVVGPLPIRGLQLEDYLTAPWTPGLQGKLERHAAFF